MNENIFNLYSKYKNLYLFQSGTGSVLFRLLPFDKTRVAEKISRSFPALAPTIEENIWEECVIEHSYPSSLHDMNAGIISTVARLIVRLSSPMSIEEIKDDLDATRSGLVDVRDQIVTKICEAFPAYKPEDVEAMDWQTQVKRLAQAEKVIGSEFNISDGSSPTGVPVDGVATKIGADGNQYIDFARENATME